MLRETLALHVSVEDWDARRHVYFPHVPEY
jgi:hypothetical protein